MVTQLTEHQKRAVELLVDGSSVFAVLAGLAAVCAEKAEHILVNWQDGQTARVWVKASDAVESASVKVRKLGV